MDEVGLGVAQIVITAATPMMEEPEQPFPPPEPPIEVEPEQLPSDDQDDEESSLSEQTAVCVHQDNDGPADSTPAAGSSSTASEGESTGAGSGPPTAPQSPPAAVRAGRASIPDELEPAQLARLTDLKESNA